jgi:hypothetical protein
VVGLGYYKHEFTIDRDQESAYLLGRSYVTGWGELKVDTDRTGFSINGDRFDFDRDPKAGANKLIFTPSGVTLNGTEIHPTRRATSGPMSSLPPGLSRIFGDLIIRRRDGTRSSGTTENSAWRSRADSGNTGKSRNGTYRSVHRIPESSYMDE